MYKILIKFNILLIFAFLCKSQTPEECEDRIQSQCYDEEYTEDELEVARKWLQDRFLKVDPKAKPCEKLRVRRDVKCLSESELQDFIDVFTELYRNGTIDRFTAIHVKHWTAAHKLSEGLLWHRWFINELEKEMIKINPNVTMPYWDFYTEFAHPEKSKISDLFGTAGVAPDYCVTNGPFANTTVNYPTPHCIARQWTPNGTIYPWESPEWVTAINQMGLPTTIVLQQILIMSRYARPLDYLKIIPELAAEVAQSLVDPTYKSYTPYGVLLAFIAHFKTHLALGGWFGDLSFPWATNEVHFYLFHSYQIDVEHLKWQLTDDRKLVPESYSLGLRLNELTEQILISNIDEDLLTYYNVPVKEAFEVGFGELCYIPARHIKPINRIVKNEKIKLPLAVELLKKALSPDKFKYWFPKFALQPLNINYFDMHLPDIGNCNPVSNVTSTCRKLPVAQRFNENPENRRQFQAFVSDNTTVNYDMSGVVTAGENLYYSFVDDLNNSDYCSPYA